MPYVAMSQPLVV
jgi:hypothetical protein